MRRNEFLLVLLFLVCLAAIVFGTAYLVTQDQRTITGAAVAAELNLLDGTHRPWFYTFYGVAWLGILTASVLLTHFLRPTKKK